MIPTISIFIPTLPNSVNLEVVVYLIYEQTVIFDTVILRQFTR